ncbi:hypothetical protein L1987_53957 [Smallanthus sonchifolius]|uniref:Uncharacterized protein n=1 Tax=Smallanthus sonchifolius TaxID=185202 RepID=A0ACB9E5B9_9ASTR|nr:hypothetical protein L1987_53957 [Smallanthus sonchifolius]
MPHGSVGEEAKESQTLAVVNKSRSDIFWFASNNGDNLVGHVKTPGPKAMEVAQRLQVGLSRKRPRINPEFEDPFDLDRFIIEENIPCPIRPVAACSPSPPQDLNSKESSVQSEDGMDMESTEGISDSYDHLEKGLEKSGGRWVQSEIDASIEMGKELGVNLNSMEDMVRLVIEGEMENSVIQ